MIEFDSLTFVLMCAGFFLVCAGFKQACQAYKVLQEGKENHD